MSQQTQGKLRVDCQHCGKLFFVPAKFAGQKGKCPECNNPMAVPQATVAAPAPAAPKVRSVRPAVASQPQDEFPFAPMAEIPDVEAESPFAQIGKSTSTTRRAGRRTEGGRGDGSFELERKGINGGVIGGILMMGIAVIWFVGGLMMDLIFIYPPILFVIGAVGLIKGLADGNMAGKKRRRRRY
jgi:phage FluMu protein Com